MTKKESKSRARLVEKYLALGHPPPHLWSRGSQIKSAHVMAARDLNINSTGLAKQIRDGDVDPDWSKYKAPEYIPPEEPLLPDVPAEEYERQGLKLRRAEQVATQLKQEKKSLQDKVIELQDMRAWVRGLALEMRKPEIIPYKETKSSTGHTAKLFVSDIHCGEFVDPAQLNGLNAYNREICKARIERLTSKVILLLTDHSTVKLDELIVLLAGDLISGAIHDELAKTDDLTPVNSIVFVSQLLAEMLATIAKKLKIKIRVVCVPGNHGRGTDRNESKDMVANSLDMLACHFTEQALTGINGIEFFYPESGEALYSIYRWSCLDLHGHSMGAGGGGGVYGPTYAMTRGSYKTKASYEARNVHIDFLQHGHWHMTLKVLPYHRSNGSVIGPSQYGMNTLKAIPEAASQNLFIFHPDNGIVSEMQIYLGHEDEGSIYRLDAPSFGYDDAFNVIGLG